MARNKRNLSVMGIYADRTTVSDAINVLHKAGYRATDISVLSSDNQGSKDFAHEKRSKGLEGAATGAAAGSVIGAILAWLVSIQTVTITLLGSLVVAGPVLAALAGAGAGGALGWIVGLLAGMRLPEYVAKRARSISSAPEAAADYGTTNEPTEKAQAIIMDRGEAPAQKAVEHAVHDTRK